MVLTHTLGFADSSECVSLIASCYPTDGHYANKFILENYKLEFRRFDKINGYSYDTESLSYCEVFHCNNKISAVEAFAIITCTYLASCRH